MRESCCHDKNQNYNVDTYTEQRLLELCSVNSRKIKIYFDWQSCKEDYERRTSTIVYDFQHYSLHDRTHSVNIIECIEMFLGKERIQKLEIGDLWLILQAAYGHDIGMCIRYEELKNLWQDKDFTDYLEQEINNPDSCAQESILYYRQVHNRLFGLEQMTGIEKKSKYQIYDFDEDWPLQIQRNVNLIICEYFRKNHAKRSRKYIEKYTTLLSRQAEQRLYQLVGKVSYAHSADFQYILENIPYEVDGFCNEKMHPQFVAALLRLGDLLDMDNNRFDSYAMEHFGELPETSEFHLEKHLSISHLRITEKTIESVAETEKVEVARVVQRWFSSLNEEVKNITSHWNQLVPEKIGGCIFRNCELNVFLNGNRYTSVNEKNFNIDKRKLITLLMGSNIYDGELMLFREYIQNAMDATKVKIWLDVLKGEFDYYLWKNDREKDDLLPLDLKKDYLSQLTIELNIELLSDTGEIRFAIKDKGIGIDDECIDAISNIGKGWRGREKYRKYIAEMPAWLRPTGGFGIGMQSGFMLTNEVTIVTKSKNQGGMKVILVSPDAGGEIIRQHYPLDEEGTEISFTVPIVRLYAVERIREKLIEELSKRRSHPHHTINGYFDYKNLPAVLGKIIKEFLEETIPNNLIPIRLKHDSESKPVYLQGSIFDSLDQEYHYDFQTKLWHYFDESSCAMLIWDEERQIYASIKPEAVLGQKQKCRENLCFKNVIVKQSSEQRGKVLGADIVCKLIDFMGFKTEDCLKIHRNEFLDKFDVGEFERKYIHFYVNWVAGKAESLDLSRLFRNTSEFLAALVLIDGLYFGAGPDVQKLVQDKLFSSLSINAKVLRSGEEYYLEDRRLSVDRVYSDCIASVPKRIMYYTDEKMEKIGKRGLENQIRKYSTRSLMKESLDKYSVHIAEYLSQNKPLLVCSSEEDDLLSVTLSNMLSLYNPYPECIFRLDENQSIVALIYEEDEEEKKENDVYWDIVEGKRLFIKATHSLARKYENLLVDELPFSGEVEKHKYKNDYLIIIPFDSTLYGLLEKGDELIYMDNFIEKMKKSDTFKACVQWVLMHPLDGMRHSKKEIENDYVELSKKIYQQAKERIDRKK